MTRRFGSARLRASASSLALVAGCLALAHPAAAQTTGGAQAAPAPDQGGSPIVTVTAERRTINLQAAPVAATVVSGAQLQQRGVYTVDQLQFISPSLTVTNFGDGEDFNIRGIGKGETNIQTPSGIVTYRDGVAVFPGFFTEEPYFDIANIEILRGPQGTFAGQNADGGAIFITENDPSLSGDHGSLEAQYGNYNDVRLRGVLNMPLSDTFALRIAANAEREDSPFKLHGPFTGDPGRIQAFNARVSLLWEPTAALRVEFKNDFNYLDAGGIVGSPIPIPAGPPYPTYASAANLWNVGNNAHNLATSTWNRSVLNIAYTFPDGVVLKSISGYQIGYGGTDYSLDGTTTLPADYFSVIGKENIWSEELNLISADKGPFRWVLGAYYQDDTVRIPGTRPGFDISTVPTNGLDILLNYTTPKTTEAAFGQVSYDITDALQLVAGARYTHSTFTLSDTTSIFLTIPGLTFFPLGTESAHQVQNDDAVTGKIDLNWKLDANNFVYVFVANGHKPGGINTTPLPFVPGSTGVVPFQPENLTTFEIGWKPTFFDGHLRAQLDGFYTSYQGFQLSFATAVVGGGSAPGQSIIRNVPGTTIIYGLEGQAQAVFGDWAFTVSADYLHTQLGSTSLSAGGPTLPIFGVSFPENISGNQQPYAPQWTFNAGAQYTFHLGDGATLTPRVDYSYTGDQWASPFQGRDPTLPAGVGALEQYIFHLRPINLVNAQLTWSNGPVLISLYGTNIFNEQYFSESGTPGLRIAGAPSQFGIRASRTF